MEKQLGNLPESARYAGEDEIDLFELWNGLVEEKKLILVSFIAVIAIATVYAFWVKPTYQSSAYFLPPEKDAIQELNRLDIQLGRNGSYVPLGVMNAFTKNLTSRSILNDVFKENNLMEVFDSGSSELVGADYQEAFNKAFERFLSDYSVNFPRKNANTSAVSANLALQVSEQDVQRLLSKIVNQAIEKTTKELSGEVLFERQTLMDQTQKEIDSARLIAKAKRMDRIARLGEAIVIARKLNLAEPKAVGPEVGIQGVQAQGLPLYYLGYKLLEAEKSALLERKSDDPFIERLRDLEERLALLNAVQVNLNNVSVVKVDQAPTLGEKIKPKKALILAVAGVLGLMLGVFVALIRRAVKKRRAEMTVS
ncbi:LPS O-antigen chain length determinant protein WzzB [Hydrogenovibrio thermophilus]|uniref:Polysaccharide chain length determinant N-terminal domain-containing protein n=1 Tax=Hydrogenovibrio thermophilus TaxID=265883 RepID=A0A410H4F8_9GAMM|nr:Wzz/FepE/Etk N-terminal domain-containing protein [Hydrogenovibrio thermophilus]QAB15776.1 hypothetical protein EPV75_08890 [Hydrogenovibrio thermophilus]